MVIPPANSEIRLLRTDTQIAAGAAAISQKAWHVLALLFSLGRPAQPDELASKCKLFYLTPDFILFLCSIPNSPLQLTHSHFVTISNIGFTAVAQFFANSDVIKSYLSSPQFGLRLLENVSSSGIVRTYSRKRKRFISEVEGFPHMKASCYFQDFEGENYFPACSRNRKRRVTAIEFLSQMKNNCYFLDFNEKKKLNETMTTMADSLRNRSAQAYITEGSTSTSLENVSFVSVLTFDPQKLEGNPTTSMNFSSRQLDHEIKNIEYGSNEIDDKFMSQQKLCCLHRLRCQSDSLSHWIFSDLPKPIMANEIMNFYPATDVSLLPCRTDTLGIIRDSDMKIEMAMTAVSHGASSWLEVDQQMVVSQEENQDTAQACAPLTEDTIGKRNVLVFDSGRCSGHEENQPMDTITPDKSPSGKLKTEFKNTVLFTDGAEVHLECLEDTLKHQGKSFLPKVDQDDLGNHLNEAICQTIESGKGIDLCLGPKQLKSNKKPLPVKPKVKRNGDQDINSKIKRAVNMEHRKQVTSISINNNTEQKPFPEFESFAVDEEEGSGGYGTVYRAKRKSDGVTFAIKCPHVNANKNHVHNELKMLERLGGKNFVIKYEGSFKSGNSDCLVLEHVQHDRPEVLKREINVFQLQWYGYCMFKALAGLHKLGIVHRDVKPGNFLFSRKASKGYLIDFNLALDLHKKYATFDNSKAGHGVNSTHIPLPQTKSLPLVKDRKLTKSSFAEGVSQNAGKGSRSILSPGNLKKKAYQTKGFTESSSRNIIKSQGADGSGITSAMDATSRTPSAERFREPMPSQGRRELINLVQEALQSGNHESVNTPVSKRKRVAAPPGNADRKFFYPTPMPLHACGITIGGAGLLKSNGKHKREGPCVGTKGFRAPEVLFRSLHQGTKVDIWSAGVTLLYLMIGRSPFLGDPEQNIKEIAKLKGSEDLWEVAKLHNQESLFPTELLDVKHLSPVKLRDWCARNTRRPDFLEAMPRSLFDLVDRCLTVNPRMRISAEEALRHDFFTPCHEALRKQRLQIQGPSLDSANTTLLFEDS